MTLLRLAALSAALVVATTAHAQQPARRGQPDQKAAPQSSAPAPRQEKTFPTKASWVAVSLNGKPFAGERPTFTLDEQFRMRGFSGCNTFSATAYPLREQTLAVGPFALTKKSCDKGVMASENAFLVALRTAAKWDFDGRTLVIRSQNGELQFERVL